jgi:outer membrane protein OmpA-like peptidoglycan-associated protein
MSAFAQKRDNSKLSPNKKHEVAHKLIEIGGYYTAIDILKELVAKDTANKKYIFKLAEAYYKARDYKNAEKLYPRLKENTSKGKGNFVSIATYHHAECLKYNGKYEQARELFQLFINSNYKDTKGANLKQLAKNEIKACEYAAAKRTSDIDVKIGDMGDNINSPYSDFAPVLKDDNTLIYSALKSDTVILTTYGEQHDEHVKLYESDYENGSWGASKEIKTLTPSIGHAANGSFSQDRKRFYFTRCKTKKDGNVICNIFVSEVDSLSGDFSKPQKLKSGINHKKYTSTQPVVGKREVKAKNSKSKPTIEEGLYFSSDMRGTYGGMDIWFSAFDKEGNLSEPANCGKTINSVKDEITPYYDQDAGVLYFSSDYHPGFGGFDVFKSKGWATKWVKPENLKMPINSSVDDSYYTLLPDNKLKGFLVSNRAGGTPLTHETCCDDIWSLEYKIPTILVVTAIDSLTKQSFEDNILVKAGKFEVADSLFDEASIDFDTVFSNSDPHFLKVIGIKEKFEDYYVIGSKKKVSISVTKQGYNFVKAEFDTDSLALSGYVYPKYGAISSTIDKNVVKVAIKLEKGDSKPPVAQPTLPQEKKDTLKLASSLKEEFFKVKDGPTVDTFKEDTIQKKKEIVEVDISINLSFDFKEISLNEKNLLTLDSLVFVMKKNTTVNFEIDTHTDGIGSEQYNLDLSNKRAAFIANYLIKKGISRKRITARGFGETKPLVPETKADGSDNPEARQKNRRTEIRLFSE